jgi:hypothetical protein
MPATDADPLAPQQIAQHPRACEGMIEMQFVEAAHQLGEHAGAYRMGGIGARSRLRHPVRSR